MSTPPTVAKICLVLGATDMRKAINGFSLMVADALELDPLCGAWFVFCNRNHSIIRVLYWSRNGFYLWQKRLVRERFHWPQSREQVPNISGCELAWLLEDLDLQQVREHRETRFKSAI